MRQRTLLLGRVYDPQSSFHNGRLSRFRHNPVRRIYAGPYLMDKALDDRARKLACSILIIILKRFYDVNERK